MLLRPLLRARDVAGNQLAKAIVGSFWRFDRSAQKRGIRGNLRFNIRLLPGGRLGWRWKPIPNHAQTLCAEVRMI